MAEVGRLQAMITVLWFPSISMTVRASLFAEMPQLHDGCGGQVEFSAFLRSLDPIPLGNFTRPRYTSVGT
jgi:hypothetical protein